MNNSFFDKTFSMCPKNSLKAGINIEKCKRCYKCVLRCPMNAIVMGENGYPKVDEAKCNGCRLCEKSCIDFYYSQKDELSGLSAKNKSNLIKVVDTFLQKHGLTNSGEAFVVGFSGGYDSISLLHILIQLRNKYNFKLFAAHLNHGWRGAESKSEEIKCKEFCSEYNINFYSEKLSEDIDKTETAAREARYAFFARAAKYFDLKNILTAHNKTDVSETLVYRIAKGTGVRGLCGIDEKRNFGELNIYRPLLSISRNEIEEYCANNKLTPNNDSSNFDTKYKRNFIRHEVLPMLEKINPNVKNVIYSLSENAKENEEIIKEYLSLIYEQILFENTKDKIKTNKFLKLSDSLKQRIIYDLITKRDLDYDRKKILEILEFVNEASGFKTGKTLSLTNDLWLFCSKKELYFITSTSKKIDEVVKITNFESEYFIKNLKFIITKFTSQEKFAYPKETELYAYVDLNNQKELELRFRKSGDKIQPFGMNNLIKLKDFFINKAVPKHKKDEIVLLCNHDEVLWACSVGLSEKLRVTNMPTHIIRIEEV